MSSTDAKGCIREADGQILRPVANLNLRGGHTSVTFPTHFHFRFMTEQQLQQINDKLFTFLRTLTPEQAQWVQTLRSLEIHPHGPEEIVFETVVSALRVGIRSSTARLLLADQFTTRGISFSPKKVAEQSWAAKQYFENLGTQPHAPTPALVISMGETTSPAPETSQSEDPTSRNQKP